MASAGVYYFVIVGPKDVPIFELDSNSLRTADASKPREDARWQYQLLIHSSLDVVDDAMWTTNASYLKAIEKRTDFNAAVLINALITPSGVRLMLLHDQRSSEEAIRSFMENVQELYLKALLNPFHDPDAPIQSSGFGTRVRKLAAKYWVL